MEEKMERSTEFRLKVVTGVSEVSGCSAKRRKTADAFRSGWVPNIINVTPRGDAAISEGRVNTQLRDFAPQASPPACGCETYLSWLMRC
jgi:hypothetical protein